MADLPPQDPLRPWAVSRGGWIHDAVAAKPIPSMGGGFGVVALKDIPQHTKIASMPLSMLVTAKSARAWCGLPSTVPPIHAIMIFLATERLAAAPSSPWHEWISRLPSRYDNFIELQDVVSADEVNNGAPPSSSTAGGSALESMLESSLMPIPRYRRKILHEIRHFHGIASAILDDAAALFTKLREYTGDEAAHSRVDRRLLRWAFNSLMSRGFGYSEETWAMVPWVDYLNFSNHPTAHATEGKTGGFDFVTNGRVRAGGQLFITYGIYTDMELAFWYGFTLCSGPEQPHDHQANCSYCFSPLGDTDGEIAKGAGWALQLAKEAGFHTMPAVWAPIATYDHGRCRVTRSGCTADMQTLIQDIAEANDVPPVVVARSVLEGEVASFGAASAEEANDQTAGAALPCAAMAAKVAQDSMALLRGLVALSDAELESWLTAEVAV